MKPDEIFGVVVRSGGFFVSIIGAVQAFEAADTWITTRSSASNEFGALKFVSSVSGPHFLNGLCYVAAGIAVIRFADALVRFAYPTRAAPQPSPDASRSNVFLEKLQAAAEQTKRDA